MPIALLALAIAAFGIGTTEFVMMGVLPEIAAEFGVDIPTAGHLITAYAVGVVLGAPTITALASRWPRKHLLSAMMVLFVVGNVLFAVAPNHFVALLCRFLIGLPHGVFFGSGAVVAASLVRPDRQARAVSMMFVGLTLANVVGVPLGTLLGQQVGWRFTFAVVAGIGVLAVISIQLLIPLQHPAADASLRSELAAFRKPQVWLALAIVTFGLGGTFATLSYIAPMMTDVAGYHPSILTPLLAAAGVGMTLGVIVGGRLADRALMPSLYGSLTLLAVVLGVFTFTAAGKVSAAVTLFVIGFSCFLLGPMVQARVMDKAGGSPSLVSAAVQSAFNIANSLGAYFGGLVIAWGFGLVAPNVVGSLMALAGLALALASGRMDRKEAETAQTAALQAPASASSAQTEATSAVRESAYAELSCKV